MSIAPSVRVDFHEQRGRGGLRQTDVPAEDVHASHLLDRRETLHDGALPGKFLCSDSQACGDDYGHGDRKD